MRSIDRRCAGLDVHKNTISACIGKRLHGHKIETVEAVFGTFTQDLERLHSWRDLKLPVWSNRMGRRMD